MHQILLPRNGIYILENMNTAPLVADKAWEFMFVLGHVAHHRRGAGDHQPGGHSVVAGRGGPFPQTEGAPPHLGDRR